jgi:hypothetical protein
MRRAYFQRFFLWNAAADCASGHILTSRWKQLYVSVNFASRSTVSLSQLSCRSAPMGLRRGSPTCLGSQETVWALKMCLTVQHPLLCATAETQPPHHLRLSAGDHPGNAREHTHKRNHVMSVNCRHRKTRFFLLLSVTIELRYLERWQPYVYLFVCMTV